MSRIFKRPMFRKGGNVMEGVYDWYSRIEKTMQNKVLLLLMIKKITKYLILVLQTMQC
jgi:hypothetical protein